MTMQFLQDLLENTDTPLLYALILGLLTAISPCQFARNITAISYISRDIQDMTRVFLNGLFYALGNAAGYSSIGIILFLGASKFQISRVLVSYGNIIMGLLLFIVGIFMLEVIKFRIPAGGWIMEKIQERKYGGTRLDSALLGFLFALSFCPYNAALFFGMLIPLTITSTWGLFIPAVYSLAAGVPVLIIAYLLAFSVAGIGSFYNKVKVFQVWFNRLVAGIFIATGIYFIYQFLLQRFFTM
jgi:cytochrome c-type biogenesis protein